MIYTFHYVREHCTDHPYSNFYSFQRFKAAVKQHLTNGFTFLTVSRYYSDLLTGSLPEKPIVLTFDDSISDHYSVANFLSSLSIPATFYVPSAPYISQTMLDVHKAHLIVSKKGNQALDILLHSIRSFLGTDYLETTLLAAQSALERYNTDDLQLPVKTFKRIVNYTLPPSIKAPILDICLKRSNIIPSTSFYLTTEQLKSLHFQGHEIGAHGHTHTVLSSLSPQEQHAEISLSKNYLEDLLKTRVDSFCYPYGRSGTYNHDTQEILRSLDFITSVTVSDSFTYSSRSDPFLIPRIDCNSFQL